MNLAVASVMDLPEQRVLSGIQPSGAKHLGNYFGAIDQHVTLQERYPGECFYFIADYHALTTVRDGAALRESVAELAANDSARKPRSFTSLHPVDESFRALRSRESTIVLFGSPFHTHCKTTNSPVL